MNYEEIDRYDGGRLLIAMQQPFEKPPRLFGRSCSAHPGGHELLDLEGFSVEKDGVEYVPKESAILSYCAECMDEERDYELRDAGDAEVVADVITRGTNWRELKNLFTPRELQEGRELQYCPYCGEELGSVDQESGHASCPEHGPLNITAKQLRKAEA